MRNNFNKSTIYNIVFLVFICILCIGCSPHKQNTQQQPDPIIVYDSLKRQIILEKPLTRVVIANAYNVDLTEMVDAIGALDTIVGIDQNILWNNIAFHDKFNKNQLICAREGLALNYEKIIETRPQALLISSKGSWSDAHKKLSKFGIKVIVIDTHDLEQFSTNCDLLGKIFGKEKKANEIKLFFEEKLNYVKKQLSDIENRKTVYFECGGPGATTMPRSYFYSLVKYTGGINIMDDAVERHVVPESIVLRNPEYIIKMSDRRWKYSYIPPTLTEHKLIKQEMLSRPGWDEITAVKKNNIFQLSFFAHSGASKIIGVLYVAKYLYPEYLPDLHPEKIFEIWLTKYLKLKYLPGHTYPAMSPDY